MSLEQELSSAESLLRSADVTVHADIRLGAIDPEVDTVLAAVAREAITNLLRHSRAGVCAITAVREGGNVRLRISNDGVDPGYRDMSPHSGSGLGNLETRLRAVQGRLTVSRAEAETFALTAEAPARPDRAAPRGRAEAYAQGPVA